MLTHLFFFFFEKLIITLKVLVYNGIDKLHFHGRYHRYQRGHPLRRANQMSTSLTKVAKPYNTGNNTSGGYKDSCMNRW